MFIPHVGQPGVSKPALSNYFMLASVMKKKTSYSTFRLNLLQHLGEHSIFH